MSFAQAQAVRQSTRHLLPLFTGRRSLDAVTSQVIGNTDFTGSGKSVYVGFDPTSDRLHLGNMFQIVSLARASLTGLQPIFLLGTATAKIGDPSGKSQERTMLDDALVTSNANSISKHVQAVIRNMRNHINHSGSLYQLGSEIPEFTFQGNLEFYSGMNSLSFLADVGRHFRVNTLLSRDSVQNRLNSQEGISFTEFSYQLLQAYDFLKLYQTRKCILQIGGSDQWGNIVSGVELVRKLEKQTVYGLTTPLLTTTDGKKFGKSEGNAIWVTQQPEDLLEMYQYLINLPDPLIEDLLFRLTFLPESEIQHTMAENQARPDDSIPKKRLAQEILSYITGSKDKAEGVSKYSTYFNLDLESLVTINPHPRSKRAANRSLASSPTS